MTICILTTTGCHTIHFNSETTQSWLRYHKLKDLIHKTIPILDTTHKSGASQANHIYDHSATN